jgi:hypothetical protein
VKTWLTEVWRLLEVLAGVTFAATAFLFFVSVIFAIWEHRERDKR